MSQTEPKPNKFTFTSDYFQIVYYPVKPGPIIAPDPNANTGSTTSSSGPVSQLQYQGDEGEINLTGDAIETQESTLGTQLTFAVQRSVDAGGATITVLVPPINMAGQRQQNFDTLAIRTQNYGILPREGARLTYEGFDVQGLAEIVLMPR